MKDKRRLLFIGVLLVVILVSGGILAAVQDASAAGGTYLVLGWNNLGMHCYNNDFRDMAVLPPYNTLWVQVVKRGNPPTLVTQGIIVSYSFPGNTYSAGKTNFWKYVKPLFGVSLAPNVGLTGIGLRGNMKLATDHYVAEGIPLTEYNDNAPTTRQPYQLASIVVKDAQTGRVLARQTVVAPVSSEMRCDGCHSNGGKANPTIETGRVATNILTLHDKNEGTKLMSQRPVLCANCHGSNALGMVGDPSLLNLSNAMHRKHSGAVPNTLNGCYNCHPGPTTRCLRDVMSTQEGMPCISCHGPMQKVARNATPWLAEPRCHSCHDQTLNNPLYRQSTGHAGLYCEACHDSTHAIAPSRNPRDGLKFVALQGSKGPLTECSVCHTIMQGDMQADARMSLHSTSGGK
jgi:hypothetical protein